MLTQFGLEPLEAVSVLLRGGTALVYLALAGIVLAQQRRSVASALLALACAVVAGSAVLGPTEWRAEADLWDFCRTASWFVFVLHICRLAKPADRQRRLTLMALVAVVCASAGVSMLLGTADWRIALPLLGLVLAIGQMLMIEDLYRSATEQARWHIGLACIALGMVSGFDMLAEADRLLFNARSTAMLDGRWLVALLTSPLLAVGLARTRDWSIDLHVSRSVAFHSATLVVSGVFLVAMAVAGELIHRLGLPSGDRWSHVAELCLLFSGLLTLAVLLTSASARSMVRHLVMDHFFSHRFDYRREWLRCIDTLCSDDGTAVPGSEAAIAVRAIKIVCNAVDSPAGLLLSRAPNESAWRWVASWNMPVLASPVPADQPFWRALGHATEAVELGASFSGVPPLSEVGPLWLAVPLRMAGDDDQPACGCILTAPPRVSFRLDREVFALLRVLGLEAATHLANHRASRTVAQTRELRDYGSRFAFVAHDIKNVSGQLSLLLANAEHHLENPDFRTDMLVTIRASVARINRLIKRLDVIDAPSPPPCFAVAERLRAVRAAVGHSLGARIHFEDDAGGGLMRMDADAFDAAIGHLLTNAVQATRQAGADAPVRMHLGREGAMLRLDIVDSGPGMSAEFIRDTLFEPFRSTKPGGSGIGAFQARELLRRAGCELTVLSKPGRGTTIRIALPVEPNGATLLSPVRMAV